MSIVLGIDTGGTYTDGVIMDIATKKIFATAKAETTHYDLAVGIRHCLEQLAIEDQRAVAYISLSTTLATNAIVEGKGGHIGLILIGAEKDFPLPDCTLVAVDGGHDIRGQEVAPLDLAAIRQSVEQLKGKVSAVAVSSFLSVRNPEHEIVVKKIVQEQLAVPVIAAHELTTALGFRERTVTAVLNGRLLPIIDELMGAVKGVLTELNIDAPIMVVKGDGSLMNESVAKERPIETILSGPAASIIGANFLNDIDEGLILDMGGTTTDIAILKDGLPRLDAEGATVGGWLTRVRAAKVNTFGLGGDSRITYDHFHKCFHIGPRRVRPLTMAAKNNPQLATELKEQAKTIMSFAVIEPTDCLYLLREPDGQFDLTALESAIIDALRDGAHTYSEVGKRVGYDPNLLPTDRILRHGFIGIIGLTPTDILHYTGEYRVGDTNIAQLAVAITAEAIHLDRDDLIAGVKEAIRAKLCYTVLNSAIHYENGPLEGEELPAGMAYFLNKARRQQPGELFTTNILLHIPIIGIGAPVASWLPPMSEDLHATLILPPYSEVANAVGAAVGKVMDICRIAIVSQGDHQIVAFTPWEKLTFQELEEAVTTVAAMAKERMIADITAKGVAEYELLVNRQDKMVALLNIDHKMHIETNLEIVAVGRPGWGKRN